LGHVDAGLKSVSQFKASLIAAGCGAGSGWKAGAVREFIKNTQPISVGV
jgi:hypothetical protein